MLPVLAPCVTFSPFPAAAPVPPLPGPVADLHDASFAELTWVTLAPLLASIQSCRVSADGGISFKRGPRHERALRAGHPSEPATITVGNTVGGGRLLLGDFDVAKAHAAGAEDPAAMVAAEAAQFVALIERCGGRAVHDVSPSAGRHVYVQFARSRPWPEIKRLAAALSKRFTTFDAKPLNGPLGQIRPPGAAHKRTQACISRAGKGASRLVGPLSGYLTLTLPLHQALEVLQRPCPMSVWERLETELRAELTALDGAAATFDAPRPRGAGGGGWSIDPAGSLWLQPRGGRRALPPRLAAIAASGDHGGYASPSEARIAVFNSAAGAGWRLEEVLAEARPGGVFAGLDALLGSRTPAQCKAVVRHDWDNAVRSVANYRAVQTARSDTSGRNSDTSQMFSTRPPGGNEQWYVLETLAHAPPPSPSVWHHLYWWAGAVWHAERDPVRCKGWGRKACSVRLVLRGLLIAARMSGSTTIEFGVRSLSLACGPSRETVSDVLQLLREEDDPLIDLVMRGTGETADVYQLRLPDAYRVGALRRPWRAGRIEAGHPTFHVLGPVCALLYEALGATTASSRELAIDAVLSSSAVTDALRELARHGLAERVPGDPTATDPAERRGGWRRGPATLDQVAAHDDVRAYEVFEARVTEYRTDRADWHAFLQIIDPAEWHDIADRVLADELDTLLTQNARQHPAPEDWSVPADIADADRADFLADHPTPPQRPEPSQPAPALVPPPAPAPDDASTTANPGAGAAPPGEPEGRSSEPPPTSAPPPTHGDAAQRGAALARRLLAARTHAEREQILAEIAARRDL